MAGRKPEITYASLEMIRYALNPMREIGTPVDRLAEQLEGFDPEAKEAHRIAGKYVPKKED